MGIINRYSSIIIALILILYTSPAYAVMDAREAAKEKAAVGAGNFGPDAAGLEQIEQIVGNVIFVVVYLGFIAMLILLIMAGFKYLTSGGEPKAIQSAHHTVTWALLGLLFMAIAWLILQLVQAFTGINVTVFDIKTLCKGPINALQFCQP